MESGCKSPTFHLLVASLPSPFFSGIFPLSHWPHWLTVKLGFSVTDRPFLKVPSFIRRDRKNGETMDRKLGFQPSSPCMTCLVSDLNTGMDLDLSELVSSFSFLFFFVCDRSMYVQVGCTCLCMSKPELNVGVLFISLKLTFWDRTSHLTWYSLFWQANKNLLVSIHLVLGDDGWYGAGSYMGAGDPNSRPDTCIPFTSSTESSIQLLVWRET